MKLCSCNKCNGIFEDMNPQTGAPEFDIKQHTDLPALVHCYDKDDVEQKHPFWGCPICLTDSYLSDNVDVEKLKEIENK